MTNMSTVFDANEKVWYGWQREEILDENVSAGELALKMMRNKSSNETCQISDIDDDNISLTYHEALSNAIQLAKHMRKWHLTYYDIIGIVATNKTYVMQIVLAAWFNGLAFHAINPLEKEDAIYYLFNKTKPKVIFCDGLYLEKLQSTLLTLYPIVCTICNHCSNLDIIRIEDLLVCHERDDSFCTEPLKDGCDQTMAILCTSGTIGLPKCVRITNKMCLTDYGLLSKNSLTIFSFCNIDWIFGFYALLANILYGNLRIITNKSYSPDYLRAVINKYQVNCLFTTSTQISQCIDEDKELFKSVKFVLISGSSCFKSNLQHIRSTLNHSTVINIYGTSECGAISANFSDYKTKSVGQLFSNIELKIVDEATGKKLGPYEIGVLCVRNSFHNKCMGYYGDLGAFYKILDKDDYIITGDLGFMDNEHYLYLSDRREIVLQYKHFYYSPHEFQVIIAQLDQVQDVCVVGIPHEKKGDIPAAVVVKAATSNLREKDITEYVKLKKNIYSNCLDYGVFFIKEIPRNHNGKVLIKDVVELCINLKNKKGNRLTALF